MKQPNKDAKEKAKEHKHNHSIMMMVCCVMPLVLLIIAINFFGLSKSYLYWLIILLCPIMHFFMMKGMHKKHSIKEGNGKCH